MKIRAEELEELMVLADGRVIDEVRANEEGVWVTTNNYTCSEFYQPDELIDVREQ
jgi:hypothetical protein